MKKSKRTKKSRPKHSRRARPDSQRRLQQNSRIARVLKVLELIQGRGRWNAKSLAAAIEYAERTVYRDLQALELAGVPWYFDQHEKSYRVRPSFRFPTVNLTDEELLDQATASMMSASASVGVGRGAKSTTRKLAATNEESARLLEDAEQLMSVLDLKLANHSRHQKVIRTVQWALVGGKQITGRYASPYYESPIKLTLHPYRLCMAGQCWYVVARPQGEDAPKTYRVARFRALRALDRAAEVPADFDMHTYFGNAWNVFRSDESYDVEVEFTADAAPLVTETQWHRTQTVKQKYPDGRIVLAFTVDGLDEILWWVLGWSGRVKVRSPEPLRVMVVEQLERALRLNSE
ncbi:MAG: WYL domain-containing transcriptional regulator [Pirellulales bacterium]